jgi:hypothetical protein
MKGKDVEARKWFIVMNSQLEYFAGLFYGGELLWSRHYEDAKPLDDEAKFITIKSLTYGEELIMDYIK